VKKKTTDTKILPVELSQGQTEAQAIARATVSPAINVALVTEAYQGHVLGNDFDLPELVDSLKASMSKSNAGDLSELENMLVGQATALQTMFVSLARRAQGQQYQKNLEVFLGLALKAQAQSRATIQAIVDLKYPRQATFVKQANIANGPQQVNNGMAPPAHALENQTERIEVLEGVTHGSKEMDTRATAAPAGGNTTVEAVATVHRTRKRGGKG
jgi:hypothetical protein